MEATARVVAVGDGRAQLACDDRKRCGACGAGRGCALRWLASGPASTLEVRDQADDLQVLRLGEAVTIGVDEGEMLRAAAVVYLPPLAGLLTGALLGHWLDAAGDGGTMAAALLGATAGWWVARAWSRRNPPRVSIRKAPERPG
jgi:sigma-E factor negative regulatory protein RseC